MPEKLVISFRGVANVENDGGQSFLTRALSIKSRCEQAGATLCSWSAQTFSFALNPDELEATVSLAISGVNEPSDSPDERFRAGIAQGVLEPITEEPANPEVLSWGPPLFTAVALTRAAHAGEVLLDPKLVASKPGELLLQGVRVARDGGRKVRGARLDIRKPWRKHAARSVASLKEPPLVGRRTIASELTVPLGSIGIIRADPGAGGTRLLNELLTRLAPSRALLVTPIGASREPLGALRRAIARSAAIMGGPPALPDRLAIALKRLLAGDGTDGFSAAELIDFWLAPSDNHFGALAVDDASEIDPISLEVIASSLSVSSSFRAFVRLDAEESLPIPLTSASVGAMVTLKPLDRAEAEDVAAGFAGGSITKEAQRRWARRGGGWPLGIREAMAEGFTTGDLCWIDEVVCPRRKSSGRGGIGTPRHWIDRRITYLSDGERTALTALATLGGDAAETMIDALAVGIGGPGAHSAVVVESLIAAGWVVRPEPGWLKLTSRTARDALLAALGDDARKQWNMAAAGMLRHYSGALGHADAAWHAAQAGDRSFAAELALDTARAAQAAGLDNIAEGLRALARELAPPPIAHEDGKASRKATLFPPPPATSRYPFGESVTPTEGAEMEVEDVALGADAAGRNGRARGPSHDLQVSDIEELAELTQLTDAGEMEQASAVAELATRGADDAGVEAGLNDEDAFAEATGGELDGGGDRGAGAGAEAGSEDEEELELLPDDMELEGSEEVEQRAAVAQSEETGDDEAKDDRPSLELDLDDMSESAEGAKAKAGRERAEGAGRRAPASHAYTPETARAPGTNEQHAKIAAAAAKPAPTASASPVASAGPKPAPTASASPVASARAAPSAPIPSHPPTTKPAPATTKPAPNAPVHAPNAPVAPPPPTTKPAPVASTKAAPNAPVHAPNAPGIPPPPTTRPAAGAGAKAAPNPPAHAPHLPAPPAIPRPAAKPAATAGERPAPNAPFVPPPPPTARAPMPAGKPAFHVPMPDASLTAPPSSVSTLDEPPADTSPPAIFEATSQLAELAKQALVQGDLSTVELLIAQLRMTGEYTELVERMSGLVALGRGATTEALRKLQAATEADQPPAQRARALLAYGVALAATGDTEAALLEALDALSRAREAGDPHGEEACARFLARLSSAAGYSSAAVTWANVVKRVTAASRG